MHRSFIHPTIPLVTTLLALLALPLAGCYETPRPACAFYCSADGACPEGYRCAGDGWCKRMDVAESFACGASPPDAAVVDGAPVDALPADAMPDGAADAAALDAAASDASLPDAAPIDALPIDASASDASFPDPAPGANRATLR